MEHRNLIGQDTPAQEPVIRITENGSGCLHHAAVIDDKLIRLIRLVGQVAVDPINGVMLPIRRRFVDVQQELQVAVLIDFDIRHLRTSGRQPGRQVKGRHRHAAPALRTGHGNTDIPGVPAVRNNLIRLRCFLVAGNWLFIDGSLYHIPLHPIFGKRFCQLVQGVLHRFTRNQIHNADGQ